MKLGYICAVVSLVACSTGVNYAKTMKASDYFEAGPQLALAEAAARGRKAEMEKLLGSGASINFQGKEGMTALIWTFLKQNKQGYQYLLERRADPNLQMTESTLSSDGVTDGSSAMSFAAMHEDPWYLEMTLKHGGNPNLVNPVKGVPPLFQCIKLLDHSRPQPRLEQLKMLIAAGADLNARDRGSFPPIMRASILNRYDMVYIMLEAGADPTVKTKAGTSIVSTIKNIRTDPNSELYQWRAKVIGLLKEKGIDVSAAREPQKR